MHGVQTLLTAIADANIKRFYGYEGFFNYCSDIMIIMKLNRISVKLFMGLLSAWGRVILKSILLLIFQKGYRLPDSS